MHPLERAALRAEAERLALTHNRTTVAIEGHSAPCFLNDVVVASRDAVVLFCEPLQAANSLLDNGPHFEYRDAAISAARCDAAESGHMQVVWQTWDQGAFFSTHANLRCDIFGCKRVAEVGP